MADTQVDQSDKRKKDSLVEIATKKIRDYILMNNFKTGDRLPTEEFLVNNLGVSRSTIREALSMLKNSGLLESKQGSGTIIKDFDFRDTVKQLSFGIYLHAKENSLKAIFEARYILERALSPYVIKRISDEEISELELMVEAYENAESDADRFYLDACFHNKLLECAHNEYLVHMGTIILDFASIKQNLFPALFVGGERVTLKEHRQLVEACRRRDLERYQAVLTIHLNRLKKVFQ
jgi:GntR family transcriptional regulator, transcriptional repressor for pyruvate dehydrogenase complex